MAPLPHPPSEGPAHSGLAGTLALVRRQLDILSRLAVIAAQLMGQFVAPRPAPGSGLVGQAFSFEKAVRRLARIDWVLRLIEALRAKLVADLHHLEAGQAPTSEAMCVNDRETVAGVERPERPERGESLERLLPGVNFTAILKRPTDEVIALICRELGLPPDWIDSVEAGREASLLPLREKVSAKLTDEGSRRRFSSGQRMGLSTPHPTPTGPPSPTRGEGNRHRI